MSDPKYTTVAFVSANRFAVSNAAGDSFVPEFVPGLRARADCQADGIRLGTVTDATHDPGSGRTLVDLAVDAGAGLTANLAAVLHGNDVPDSLCNHAEQHRIGGRDALPKATTDLSGLVKLATAAEAKAGTVDDKAVSPAGLAATAKGLINANTTIFVRTDGNDANDGTANDAAHAKLTISGALASIAGKLIAPGVTVTIQVANGTYSIPATIALDHPDGDKISILGNTSAETSVPITSINATTKTVTVAGNYTGSLLAGDIFGLLGSSTSALNGAYIASSVAYDGTYTVITCAAESFASEVAGGGNILIKPCNRCVLNFSAYGFNITTKIKNINGFRFNGVGGTVYKAVMSSQTGAFGTIVNCIAHNMGYGYSASMMSLLQTNGCISKSCYSGFNALSMGCMTWTGNKNISDSCTFGANPYGMSFMGYTANFIARNNTTNFSPAVGSSGSGNSFIL